MPAKAPIYLKPVNSKKGKKCRLRDILSPDMISPPLGDFRHTIHIGKGGERDAFGDMSFLQGNYDLLQGKTDMKHQYGIQSEFCRANSTGDASFPETPSPVLKNAISLPTIGGCQALTLPLISSNVFPLPPVPLGDPSSPIKPDNIQEAEILQMLHSIDVFNSKPSSPTVEIQSKPDVLLDLVEKPKKSEPRYEKPYYKNGRGIYKANGSLNSNASSDSFDSFKDDFNPNNVGYERFNNDINLKQDCRGDWVDRDSGVEEGRICDFEFEFPKEKSTSQESLAHITGSLLSLELDLGPSILDDVLNIMEQPVVKSRP